MADVEKRHREAALAARFPSRNFGPLDFTWFDTGTTPGYEQHNRIAQALADAEQRGAESAKAEAQPTLDQLALTIRDLPSVQREWLLEPYRRSLREALTAAEQLRKAEAQPAGTGITFEQARQCARMLGEYGRFRQQADLLSYIDQCESALTAMTARAEAAEADLVMAHRIADAALLLLEARVHLANEPNNLQWRELQRKAEAVLGGRRHKVTLPSTRLYGGKAMATEDTAEQLEQAQRWFEGEIDRMAAAVMPPTGRRGHTNECNGEADPDGGGTQCDCGGEVSAGDQCEFTKSSKSPNSVASASGETAGSATPGSTSSVLVSAGTQTRPGNVEKQAPTSEATRPAKGEAVGMASPREADGQPCWSRDGGAADSHAGKSTATGPAGRGGDSGAADAEGASVADPPPEPAPAGFLVGDPVRLTSDNRGKLRGVVEIVGERGDMAGAYYVRISKTHGHWGEWFSRSELEPAPQPAAAPKVLPVEELRRDIVEALRENVAPLSVGPTRNTLLRIADRLERGGEGKGGGNG